MKHSEHSHVARRRRPAAGLASRRWIRSSLAVVVLAGLGGGVAVAGMRGGHPANQVKLLSGAAWLPSAGVGQLSLLDGSSVEVAAQVQVADRGDRLEAVQQGSTGYAVNSTTGTIRRVDGATFGVGKPVTPIPGAKDGLTAVASDSSLYVLDSRRGILADTDLRTLADRGPTLSLASAFTPETTVLDKRGQLWVLDRSTGDLAWISGGRQHTRSQAARPGGGAIVLADGAPVIVDSASRTASVVDPGNGEIRRTLQLDLRDGDQVQSAGSPGDARVYVMASRGALIICDLGGSTCGNAVPLGADAQPGTPVESGGNLFIPDYASGKVWIVNLRTSKAVAQPQVMGARVRFQLLTRDGVVFFNDPNSENAGVIRVDGSVRHIRKYDPAKPSEGLAAEKQPTPAKPRSSQSKPSSRPGDQSPWQSGSGQPPAPDTPAQPPTVKISLSQLSAVVDENITLQVLIPTGVTTRKVAWNFADGTSATTPTASHSWSSPGSYLVTVQVTTDSGAVLTSSTQIPITARPTLTVNVTTAGTVAGGGISCPGTCQITPTGNGQQITLTATPTTNYIFAGWSGACTGTAASCTVTMTASRNVTATFRLPTPVLKYPADNVQLHQDSVYRRMIGLTWNPTPGAARIRVEIDYAPLGTTQWTRWKTVEGDYQTEFPTDSYWDTWPGPYKGRWRVTALAADGQSSSQPSAYGTFDFLD